MDEEKLAFLSSKQKGKQGLTIYDIVLEKNNLYPYKINEEDLLKDSLGNMIYDSPKVRVMFKEMMKKLDVKIIS